MKHMYHIRRILALVIAAALIIFLTTLLIFLPIYCRFHRMARDLDGFEIIQDEVRNRDENLIIISGDE